MLPAPSIGLRVRRAQYVAQGLSELSGMRFGRRSHSSDAPKVQSHLERLYTTAKETFGHGRTVSAKEVEALSELLAAVPLQEIGLEEQRNLAAKEATDTRSFLSRFGFGSSSRIPTITYLHICENEDFGIGIFCLPDGTDLPFHDHPQMTVFSRVMYGKVQVKAYDWVHGANAGLQYGEQQPAKLSLLTHVEEQDPPIILFPKSGGNIHKFRAESSCAVLDLLAPPYDMKVPERSCTYYKEAGTQPDGTVMLEKIPDPESFRIVRSQYKGIKVE